MKKIIIDYETMKSLVQKGLTREELTQYFGVSLSTIKRNLKKFGLSTFRRIFNESDFDKLYNNGLTDSEISRQLNTAVGTISNYRKKLNKSTNFKYNRDLLRNKIQISSGNVEQISNILNIDSRIVDYFLNFIVQTAFFVRQRATIYSLFYEIDEGQGMLRPLPFATELWF